MDTKVFNIVKENITFDPVLLFLVDEKNKKVFWFYVSVEFAMSLDLSDKEKKTLYFNDSDLISNLTEFHSRHVEIHEEKLRMSKDINQNLITTNLTENKDIYAMLQEEWSYLDSLLKNDLKIVTDYMYPDTWKFGIAFQEGEEFDSIGIYQIKKGINDTFVKEFSTNKEKCFTVSHYKKDKISVRKVLNEQVSMQEVRKLWNALISFAINQNEELLKRYANQKNIRVEVNPLGMLLSCNIAKKKAAVQKFSECFHNIRERTDELPYPLVYSQKYDYELYADAIHELEVRKIKEITRPWEPKKYNQMFKQYEELNLKGFDRIETGYLIEDIYSNCDKLLRELPKAYKYTNKKIWNEMAKERMLRMKYSICYDSSDISCTYYKLVKDAFEFDIAFNEYSMKELKELVEKGSNLEKYNANCLSISSFYNSCTMKFPLYNHIWYMLNLEMWNRCDVKKPILDLAYI